MMNRKPRIGVFGLGRGAALLDKVNMCGGELVAVCDRATWKFEKIAEHMAPTGGFYEDFDEFIKQDFDGVILANYFTEHAEYAVKAMKAGKAVLSECTPASTMADCVRLLRTAEETGKIYMLAENYPYAASSQEMRRVYLSGRLGEVVFGEGEYAHPMTNDELDGIAPSVSAEHKEQLARIADPLLHWRRYLARTYYSTHSIAPLMYATDLVPKNVVCLAANLPEESAHDSRFASDGAAPMLVEMSNGAVFRVSGSVNYGPSGNWYRLDCTDGGAESVRGDRPTLRLNFRNDRLPAGVTKAEQYYKPPFPEDAEKAEKAGHGGGDYFVVRNFIRAIQTGEQPYFDVYKSVMISEMAILGWRSALSGGVKFDIPDLRTEAERRRWENDSFSPFPKQDSGEKATMPCSTRNIPTDYYEKAHANSTGAEAFTMEADAKSGKEAK